MSTTEPNYVKILLRFYSDLLEQDTVETIWAEVMDEAKGTYRVASIPFYAPLLATEDLIRADYDLTEDMLVYSETIEHSGNSTIQAVLLNEDQDIDAIRRQFEEMGCASEKLNERYFSMEVPADVDYVPVRQKLEALEEAEILSYAEPSLSSRHKYD